MWAPLIQMLVLAGGGFAVGSAMKQPQVVLQAPPPPLPASIAAAQSLSPMLVVACALFVAAVGYVIWMFRRGG